MKTNKRTITLVLFLLAIITALIIAILMSGDKNISSLDFHYDETNNNGIYEVGEDIAFEINNPKDYQGRDIIWYFGNGDTKKGPSVKYKYKEENLYKVTVEVDSIYKKDRYIKVILKQPTDSIFVPKINGPNDGYIGEKLTFTSLNSSKENSWWWKLGETGEVDSKKKQVTYEYKKEGIYTVELKTDKSQYPVYHRIEIIRKKPPVEDKILAEKDIREKLQAIADASARNNTIYNNNLRYIIDKYTCNNADKVIIVVNGSRYNDLYSYCQGLHYLEGRGRKTVEINGVVIDTINCIKRLEVEQKIINN